MRQAKRHMDTININRQKMKRISIAILMTLFFYTISFAQQKNTSKLTKQIETYLTEFEKKWFCRNSTCRT